MEVHVAVILFGVDCVIYVFIYIGEKAAAHFGKCFLLVFILLVVGCIVLYVVSCMIHILGFRAMCIIEVHVLGSVLYVLGFVMRHSLDNILLSILMNVVHAGGIVLIGVYVARCSEMLLGSAVHIGGVL